jgi:hypothetical protein
MKPQRIQLSRRKGFNLQAVSKALNGLEAINCARPSKWGNPFVIQFDPHSDYSPQTAEEAVKMFKAMLREGKTPPFSLADIRDELRGKNLACWCSADSPCHCTPLLEIANAVDQVYQRDGRTFRFNDHVCIELLMGVPDEKRTGRLVQVRKKCGQFGSDIYFVRLRDGSLACFENALMRHVGDKRFEDAFYRSNGKQPPMIPDQPPDPIDTETDIYSIGEKWPETGFIVENSKRPQTPGAFSIAVISK